MPWFQLLKTHVLAHWVELGAKAQEPQPRPLALGGERPAWTESEVEALMSAQQNGLFCYANSEAIPYAMQSVVLGFDIEQDQVLLDAFFPSPAAGVIDQAFDLSVPSPRGFLHLQVQIVQRWIHLGHPSLIARVVSKRFSRSRSASTKVTFADGHGPAAQLLLPMVPMMRGHVIELTADGLIASIPQARTPALHTREGTCTLTLDNELTVKAKVQIKHLCFSRKPFRHSVVHLAFNQLLAEQRDLLVTFISQFPADEPGHHQAA